MNDDYSITDEVDAGACGLDGEALTQELLSENRRLLADNARLKAQNDRAFLFWILTTVAYVAILLSLAFSK